MTRIRPRELAAIVAGALAGGFVSFIVADFVRGPTGRVYFVGEPGRLEARVNERGRRAFLDRFAVAATKPDGSVIFSTGAFGPVALVPVNGLFRVVVNDSTELGRQLAEDLVALRVLVPGAAS